MVPYFWYTLYVASVEFPPRQCEQESSGYTIFVNVVCSVRCLQFVYTLFWTFANDMMGGGGGQGQGNISQPVLPSTVVIMFLFSISAASILPIKHLFMMTNIFNCIDQIVRLFSKPFNKVRLYFFIVMSCENPRYDYNNSYVVKAHFGFSQVKYLFRKGKPCIRVHCFCKRSRVQAKSAWNIKVIIA